ncbi:MAG: RraA family protein, partial [Chloroflexi bacterium]|nr:RraA family protein [Chloroflexota bacterium]
MTNEELAKAFVTFTTPQIVDACVRLQIPIRIAPSGIRSVAEGQCTVGHARPVRHYGSVDVFIEALLDANPGDVLV